MGRAKDLIVKPIVARDARRIMRQLHYSGKIVPNSQLHFGVFLDGRCGGVLSFGPSTDKRKMLGIVKGTGWNEFMELNRMALADWLPRNGESRVIGISLRLIKKHYPHIKWIVSFADATQCGDGTIYRAAGFKLTSIKKNTSIVLMDDGSLSHGLSQRTGKDSLTLLAKTGGASSTLGEKIAGFQLRYIYFLHPEEEKNLTVPVLPYSAIKEAGAAMYKGEKPAQEA